MRKMSPWQEFFDGHAPYYMNNSFTKDTVREADFLIEELGLPPRSRILDIGCGTGRHAIELAKRGYRVTGVDISSGMLSEAEKAAEKAGVFVEWIHADATRFRSSRRFDAAICLCEGAFSLLGMEDDPIQHDLAILRNIHNTLKPGTTLILTAPNGFAKIRRHTQADVESGKFDPLTLVETLTVDWSTPKGKRSVRVKERGYLPQDLRQLCHQAGFEVEHIWGGTAGNWGRRTIDLDEMEIMMVARKTKRNV